MILGREGGRGERGKKESEGALVGEEARTTSLIRPPERNPSNQDPLKGTPLIRTP